MDKRLKELGTAPEVFPLLSPPLSHVLDIPTFQVRSSLGKHPRLGLGAGDGEKAGGREATGIFSRGAQTQSPKRRALWVQLPSSEHTAL